MTELEIIARQAEKILELEDKLAEEKEVAEHWESECNSRIPVQKVYAGDLSAMAHDIIQNNEKRNNS